MTTLTIKDVPDSVVARIEDSAAKRGRTLEQEIRDLLQERYAQDKDVFVRIKKRWSKINSPCAEKIQSWREIGRP